MNRQSARGLAPKRRRNPSPLSSDADEKRASAWLDERCHENDFVEDFDLEGDYARSVEDISRRRNRLRDLGIY